MVFHICTRVILIQGCMGLVMYQKLVTAKNTRRITFALTATIRQVIK